MLNVELKPLVEYMRFVLSHLRFTTYEYFIYFLSLQTFNTTNVTKLCSGAQCTFAFYGGESLYHRYIFIFQLANAFVFLWLVNFAIALGQCTLAGAFASYYWAFRKPADIPPWPLFSSFGRAIR